MKVGVLGSGDVGQALARGFASRGHDVKVGSRKPEKLEAFVTEAKGKVSAGSFEQAARHGEVLVLATQGAATDAAIDLAGPRHFDGKLVIDVTNPLDFSKGPPPGLFVGTTDSLTERTQRKLPKAKVVKCFNIVSNVQMVDPHLPGGPPDMMICGNDEGAKRTVADIVRSFGWPEPIDVGGIDGARWLEALVPLWARIALPRNNWKIAFKVLGR